ncbi:MAG TPA: hypothetical protein VK832_14720 [Burkholderiaceae bacterium]|nr:hypothetical protein [Burkholderiaceae bacterium]
MARRAVTNQWFVSVESPKLRRFTTHARQTKTFATEREAKQFAKAMLSDGIKMMAGTLQPHQPMRRIIGSSEINQWIEEEESDDPALAKYGTNAI